MSSSTFSEKLAACSKNFTPLRRSSIEPSDFLTPVGRDALLILRRNELADRWERYLERWTTAGLIEPSTAERVRAYEAQQEKTQGLRWPVVLAIGLGGLLLGAGVLLFVAAHWDRLSPGERFRVEGDRLVAEPAARPEDYDPSDLHLRFIDRHGEKLAVLAEPVAFFIPEHIPDPSRRQEGEELWAEVTIPKKGPPRPIRLGVKKGTDPIIPLDLK
jgi:hypothetical protein